MSGNLFETDAFGEFILFTDTLNALKLIDIYKSGLIPSDTFLFNGNWILQEDNDPKHMSN